MPVRGVGGLHFAKLIAYVFTLTDIRDTGWLETPSIENIKLHIHKRIDDICNAQIRHFL